jgi:hypothetical protein
MRAADSINRLIKKLHVPASSELDERVYGEISKVPAGKRETSDRPDIWRIIMKSRIIKLSAAAVIIIVILIGINQFGGLIGGSNIAFGEVLGYVQKHSYTFDLNGLRPQEAIHAMVWELGWIRVDFSAGPGVGKISSITDFNTDQTILLFHQNKTAVLKKESVLNKNVGVEGIISFCSRPIAQLWNMLDGVEEYLDEKEIDGQRVSGFRVIKEDQNFKYDITIWVDSKNGLPYIVETIATPFDQSYPTITTTMENFNFDVKLDEDLFSLDLPEGYRLAYQEELENLEVKTKPSDESKKIVQMLELWSEGKKDEAIESLLEINWTGPIEFGKEPYIFSISDKQYTSLNAEDQKPVSKQIFAAQTAFQGISKEVLALGQKEVAANQYEEAERYFNVGLQLGKLLDCYPDIGIISRLVGISIEKKSLNEMINLYETTNEQEKLQMAKEQLQTAEAEVEKIKKKAQGQ